MSKNRYINTKFWSDNFISELDPLERYLFLYFLTNEHTNIAGIYELPMRTMAFETGLDKEMLDKMLPRFEGKIYYIKGWIYIKNFPKHQIMSDSILKGIKKVLDEIPSDILAKVKELTTGCKGSGNRVDTLCDLLNPNLNPNPNPNRDIIKYKPKSLMLAKILFDLIKKNNPAWHIKPNFDQWAEDIDKINRIDNRTFEQIEFIIRWCQEDDFWQQNILSPAKLRKQFNQLIVKAGSQRKEVVVI